jgi:type II secretory pathway component PulF
VIAEKITAAADRVVEGATLSEALRVHPEIPGRSSRWSRSARTAARWGTCSRGRRTRWTRRSRRALPPASLLEPLIILVMGAVVAFIVVSVLLPLLDISNIVQ